MMMREYDRMIDLTVRLPMDRPYPRDGPTSPASTGTDLLEYQRCQCETSVVSMVWRGFECEMDDARCRGWGHSGSDHSLISSVHCTATRTVGFFPFNQAIHNCDRQTFPVAAQILSRQYAS